MKISRKLEYSYRVLAQLGRHYNKGLVHIDKLSSAESIPSNYLVQILNELRGSGIIVSKRGKQGGYALSRSPEEINLYSIVESVEPELLKSSCEKVGESGAKVSEVLDDLTLKLVDHLTSINLDSIIENNSNSMYYI